MSLFLSLLEKRAKGPTDDFWYNRFPTKTTSGAYVNEDIAKRYLIVSACVSLVSGDIAKLPCKLYKKLPDGSKKVVTNHPLSDILKYQVNPELSAYNFTESTTANIMLEGNHYSEIIHNGRGEIVELWPIGYHVTVKRNSNGGLIYTWKENNRERSLPAEKVLHFTGFGYNGLIGQSMISIAGEAIGLGLSAEEFSSRFFGSGTHPAGTLEMDADLGDNRQEFINSFRLFVVLRLCFHG